MRRFRRSFRRRRRFGKRRSRFTRRVLRAEISTSSPKRTQVAYYNAETMPQGDGTGRVAIVLTPWSSLTQGTEVSQFEGTAIYPSGVSIRGQLYNANATSSVVYVRFLYFWSRASASYGSGTVWSSTTRANAGPTQVPPFSNPTVFDVTSTEINAWTPFVGDSFATRIDTTNVKVIKSHTVKCNLGGASDWVKEFKFFFRHPRRKLTFQNPGEGSLSTAPNYPINGNYYVMIQTFAQGGTSNISATSVASMDMTLYCHWKDGPN